MLEDSELLGFEAPDLVAEADGVLELTVSGRSAFRRPPPLVTGSAPDYLPRL